MSSLFRDPSGSYRVRWWEGGRAGKHHTSQRFSTKAAATSWQRERDRQAALSIQLDGIIQIPWQALIDRYCHDRQNTTAYHRQEVHRLLTTIGERHGWHIAADVLPAVASDLCNYHRRFLRALLSFAAENGQRINPFILAKLKPIPRPRIPQHLLTESEVSDLIAKATAWHLADGAIAHCVATYGHRVQSLLELPPESLTARPGWLRLRVKSGDIHEHPILPATTAILMPLASGSSPGSPFLVGHLGRPWKSGREYAAWWGHAISRRRGAGVLDLRRYAITRMMKTGDPKAVASITGHRTPSLLLNVYARSSEDRQRSVLETLCEPAVYPPCTRIKS